MGRHADINTWSSVYLFIQLSLLKIIVLNAENLKKSTSIQIFSFADTTLVCLFGVLYHSTCTIIKSVIYLAIIHVFWEHLLGKNCIKINKINSLLEQFETLQISVNELIDSHLINYLPGGPLIVHWWFSSNSDLEK